MAWPRLELLVRHAALLFVDLVIAARRVFLLVMSSGVETSLTVNLSDAARLRFLDLHCHESQSFGSLYSVYQTGYCDASGSIAKESELDSLLTINARG